MLSGPLIWSTPSYTLAHQSPPPSFLCSPQFTTGCGLHVLAILSWEAKASFCGAPHYIWTCGLISQPPSITLTFTTSPSPLLLHPPIFITRLLCTEAPYTPVFNTTSPDRREAHTERIYQQSPYEGSGNLNIHCWHCADLAGGQSGPAPPGIQTIPPVWLKR